MLQWHVLQRTTRLQHDGPGIAYTLFLTTSVVGTVALYDNTLPSGPVLLSSTATEIASNVEIEIGGVGGAPFANGATIVVTGANIGHGGGR